MRQKAEAASMLDVYVTTNGEFPGAADYACRKIGELARFSHRPVLHARVRLTRHGDPAVERPVVAQANLDVNGRPVRAQVAGVNAREAIDRLEARLRVQLERIAEHWEARRGTVSDKSSDEWRHESEVSRRASFFPRPPDERLIIRRKSFTTAPCTVDEAAFEMDREQIRLHHKHFQGW